MFSHLRRSATSAAVAAARYFRTTAPPPARTKTNTTSVPADGETYRHYKGNDYVVVGSAIHTETQEVMVIYRRARLEDYFASNRQLFVRPIRLWRQVVVAPCGTAMFRFQRTGSGTPPVDPAGRHRD